jgi:hypothetical protein
VVTSCLVVATVTHPVDPSGDPLDPVSVSSGTSVQSSSIAVDEARTAVTVVGLGGTAAAVADGVPAAPDRAV